MLFYTGLVYLIGALLMAFWGRWYECTYKSRIRRDVFIIAVFAWPLVISLYARNRRPWRKKF